MSEWILAASTIIFAGIYLRATLHIPQLAVGDSVGPQFFPGLIGAGLLLSGAVLLFEAWQKRAAHAAPGHIHPPADPRRTRITLLAATAWTALYYALFEPAGYIVATLVYIFALLTHFHRNRWWINALITAGFTAVVYVLFAHFLNVALPAGVLQR